MIRYFNVLIFCLFLLVFGGMTLSNFQSDTQMNDENRQLVALPDISVETIKNGSFVKAFEQSFSDHFALRSELIGLSKNIDRMKSFASGGTEIVDYAGANVTEAMGDSSDGVKETKWGKILIYEGAAMELNTFHEASAKAYAESINAYVSVFPEVNIYSMLVPTQIEFIEDESYRAMSVSQRETVDKTNSYFVEEVQTVDIFDSLVANKSSYLYFRTDHHWTQRGAYYGFKAFGELIGQEVPALEAYKTVVEEGYLGSLYNVTLNKTIAKTPDAIEVFYPLANHSYKGLEAPIKYNEGNVIVDKWLDEKEKYAVFLGGDQPVVSIKSDRENGVRLLVLKDSYANALVPFFVDIAEEIIVVDPRLYDGRIEKLVEDYNITDILFVNYALITRWDGYSGLYKKMIGL